MIAIPVAALADERTPPPRVYRAAIYISAVALRDMLHRGPITVATGDERT
jgi:hypothetical protein